MGHKTNMCLKRCKKWLLVFGVIFVIAGLQWNPSSENTAAALETPAPQGTNIKSLGAVGNGTTDDTVALRKASEMLSGKIYFPTGTYVLNDDLVFRKELTLVFGQNANIKVASGKTLKLEGGLQGGLYTLFTGDGSVVATGTIKKVYPEWFGALGNAIQDDRPFIQEAVNFASTLKKGAAVHFTQNRNYVLGTMTVPLNTIISMPGHVSLEGRGTLKVRNNMGKYNTVFEFTQPIDHIYVRELTVDSNAQNNPITEKPSDTNNAMRVFTIYTGTGAQFQGVTVRNSLAIQSIMGNVVNDLVVQDCQFLNMGVGSPFFFDTSTIYSVGNNAKITRNYFEAGGPGSNTAIEVHGYGKVVSYNVTKKYRTGIIYASTSNRDYKNENNLIANNRIEDAVFGMSLWASRGDVKQLTITNNSIIVNARGGGFMSTNAESTGIQFYHPSVDAWIDIAITDNFIDFKHPGGGYMTLAPHAAGIDLSLQGSGTKVEGLLIKGNIIRNAYTNGITWNIEGVQNNIVVEENTIINPGSLYSGKEGYSSGIALYENPLFSNSFVRNNVVVEDRTTSKMYTGLLLRSLGVADRAHQQLSWINNTIVSEMTPLSGEKTIAVGNTPIIVQTPF
ncbi:glycoside hydrolase family 55 protein [Paenibacillus sp. SC116]|uniref:glycoside hydrolase family 55 protein n=1 Tax=Paenibacillus sp. SC116 TaxID=2968986 RepID=UPI00215A7BA1|nr:glycoside hydrolase family 55 protein [Paenibacillus sp. SC116]MCR8844161.1 glycoside hydrolase family 55 protein [Paenibacillus sp. SC116]